MADFPSVLNAVAFQKQGRRSVYLATLSASSTGGGDGFSHLVYVSDLAYNAIEQAIGSGRVLTCPNSVVYLDDSTLIQLPMHQPPDGWLFGYFVIISMSLRTLNKVMVPWLEMPLGVVLVAQGTAVIFFAALVLLTRTWGGPGVAR